MSDNIGYEVFVVAVNRADGSLPKESKIIEDKFYYSIEEAEDNNNMVDKSCIGIYRAIISIEEMVK